MSDQHLASFGCEAILFDLDGVLVDSSACIEGTWRIWAERNDLDPVRVVRAAHGCRAVDTVRLLAPQLDPATEVAALAAHEEIATEGIFEVPCARSLLTALPPHSWAIVTSAVRAVAEHRLSFARLPRPRVMVCADEVEHGKPDPQGYRSAAKLLGFAPAHCIVVEDAPAGLTAARLAGMRAIAVATTHPLEEISDSLAVATTLCDLVISEQHRESGARLRIEMKRGAQR